MKWRLIITPKVQEDLRDLSPQIRQYIRASLEELRKDPWLGKALKDELVGFYSFRVKHFRIVYEIQGHVITVVVVGVGRRESIYEELTAELRSKR